MRIKYLPYGSVRVSARWRTVLRAADRDKVRFHVTSGHRSMTEQQALFRQNMRWNGFRWVQRPGRPLTAFPSPLAPHIRSGRHAHAIDVNSLDGGETRLQRWLERHGAHPTNPVPNESWHVELTGRDLKRLAERF
jgi:D-alanyl-D-alanine carboxypeptidase